MRLKLYLVWFTIIALALIPLWSILWWRFQGDKVANVVIIDKTVITLDGQEHRSFNWMINYYRFVKKDHSLYKIPVDYYGFFPLEPLDSSKFIIKDFEDFSFEKLDTMAHATDIVYTTDTYGVYRNEWYLDTLQTEHSPKVYGGMTSKEVFFLKRMKDLNKLILTEFNTFCSPTPYGVRRDFEDAFGVKWSGWNCRYFDLLDTIRNPELPRWAIHLYKQQHNNEWNFTRSGLVYVHEDSRVFILENETHLVIETPFIHTAPKYMDEYNLPDSIHYPYWVDITFSKETNEVISKFKIYPNEKGDSILSVYNVPKEFPAVIGHKQPYRFYYFGGDFADNPIHDETCYFKGITFFDYFLYNNVINDRTKFFWRFYIPLVTKILKP